MTNEPELNGGDNSQTVAAGQLRAFVERVERLEVEKQAIADDIREVFTEIKGTGFDTKAVRAILKIRKMDPAERQEQEALIELYRQAMGLWEMEIYEVLYADETGPEWVPENLNDAIAFLQAKRMELPEHVRDDAVFTINAICDDDGVPMAWVEIYGVG